MPVTRGMFPERINETTTEMYKGEVYVEKGKKYINSALIIEGLSPDCCLIVRDTSARDTIHDFVPIQLSMRPSDLLRNYDKATPEQIAELIAGLKEKQGVVSEKISLLEQYAQTLPSCTENSKKPLGWAFSNIEYIDGVAVYR